MKFINGILFNENFKDFYSNFKNPFGESEFVFGSAVNEILKTQNRVIVAELGFGLGRNFLNIAAKFKNSDKILHFVSIEKFPLQKEILAKFYENFKFEGAKKLLKLYPTLESGFHRIKFSKNITLDLLFGDAECVLKECEFKADIWLMDGFSPSKNPDMWSDEITSQIARLCKIKAKIATYSASKKVQKSLENAGFCVVKTPGFNGKREMIRACFNGNSGEIKDYFFERPSFKSGKNVLIIGAGIAGIVTAIKFQNLGYKTVIAEKACSVAANASGNFCGVLEPLITKKGVKLGEMHKYAFKMAVKFYKKNAPKNLAKFCGAKEFAYNDDILKRFETHDKSEIFDFNRKDLPYASIFIKNAALLRPRKICEFFSKKLNIKFGHEFSDFVESNGGYIVNFVGKKPLKCDILIFAIGSESEELFGGGKNVRANFDDAMQISSVRGQITLLRPFLKTPIPLGARGYICPKIGKRQLIGATYDRKDYENQARAFDDERNLQNVADLLNKNFVKNTDTRNLNDKKFKFEILDKNVNLNISKQNLNFKTHTQNNELAFKNQILNVKILGSRVGFRGYSGDRFPLIGALPDCEYFKEKYKILPWQKNRAKNLPPKYLKNIYINTSHGARGLCTAILGAEILADLVTNRPFCLPKSLINELAPSRFLIRKLKKGLK